MGVLSSSRLTELDGTTRPDHFGGQAGPPIDINLGRSNVNVLFERQLMPGLEYFIKYAAWNETYPGPLQTWSCSPNLHVSVGQGSGQRSTPFSISSQNFSSKYAELGFSKPFLQKIVAKAPLFEYRFNVPELVHISTPPTHLEVAMGTFENDSFFYLLRYNLKQRSSKVLVFLKAIDHLRKRSILPVDLFAWFSSNEGVLQRHPLMIPNIILGCIQYESHQYVHWRLELYNLESRLGVTRDGFYLKLGGYAEVDHDFALLNADLAGLAKKLADTELPASTILEHAKAIQRLVGLCEDHEALNSSRQPSSATDCL
jgi:hypothetical protein